MTILYETVFHAIPASGGNEPEPLYPSHEGRSTSARRCEIPLAGHKVVCREDDGRIHVEVGALRVGYFRRVQALCFTDDNGARYSLRAFHHWHSGADEPGFLGTLAKLHEDEDVFAIGSRGLEKLCYDVSEALKTHLGLLRVQRTPTGAPQIVWPTGEVFDLQ